MRIEQCSLLSALKGCTIVTTGARYGIGLSSVLLTVPNTHEEPLKILFHMKKERKEVVRQQD